MNKKKSNMEPKKEQVKGMLNQAAKMAKEAYDLNGVEPGTALQAYLITAYTSLICAIGNVENNYIEKEGLQ